MIGQFTLLTEMILGKNCDDNDNDCSKWAKKGECKKYPNYMLEICKKSCNNCNLGGGKLTNHASVYFIREFDKVSKFTFDNRFRCWFIII